MEIRLQTTKNRIENVLGMDFRHQSKIDERKIRWSNFLVVAALHTESPVLDVPSINEHRFVCKSKSTRTFFSACGCGCRMKIFN